MLIARHERRVRGFVSTLLRQRDDVDEVVQLACLTAWKKHEDFTKVSETLDLDFVRWVCTIARFEALAFARKNRGSRLLFDSDLINKLADLQMQGEEVEDRRKALRDCIEKLSDKQADLVRRYYESQESAAELAKDSGVSRQAIFKRLRAIRVVLLDCVSRSLESGRTSR